MTPTRLTMVVGTIALGLALGACGGSSKSSSGGSESGSAASSKSGAAITCDSITKAEAEQILGGAIEAPNPASAPSTGCSWYLVSKEIRPQGITALNAQTYVFDGTLRAASNPQVAASYTIEKVSGLGDDAYFQTPKGATGSLASQTLLLVKNGNVAYNIGVSKNGLSEDQVKALEKQAAQTILAKS